MTCLLKFGFHNFLNAQPLLETLREKTKEGNYELVLDSPAAIARKLDSGELSLGMIPSIEYLRNENRYKIIPPLAIASKGPVETVLFIVRKNLEEIRTVTLDERSMTSAALVKLLFQDRFTPGVQFKTLAPNPVAHLKTFDAVLIIGDKAFEARNRLNQYMVYDLSERWYRQTGKPFVHAVLAAPKELELPKILTRVLNETLNRALKSISKIAETHAARLGLNTTQCEDYLNNKILYRLDSDTRSGLNKFRFLCQQAGILQ